MCALAAVIPGDVVEADSGYLLVHAHVTPSLASEFIIPRCMKLNGTEGNALAQFYSTLIF